MADRTLFRHVDIGVFVATFATKLRLAGLSIGLGATNRCSEALVHCPPSDRATLYWVTRSCLVQDHRDFDVFDQVFTAIFDADGLPIAPWDREQGASTAKMTGTVMRHSGPTDGLALAQGRITTGRRPEIVDEAENAETEPTEEEVPELYPAAIEALADEPFDQLGREDLELLCSWLQDALVRRPHRRSRRQRRSRRGRVDVRRTLALARSTGVEPVELAYRRPRTKPRRVVMLADVSGSMESFTRVYLHLMRALVTQGEAEVFTFATTLRRVTVPLARRDPQAAIDRLSDEVADRFGGTRIAASIAELTRSPFWSHSLRGAILLVASDGWDTDPPDDLEREMARLARLAHRIIWINPRSVAPDYEPLVGGMAAALPHTDVFLSGHSLRAMRTVIDSLT